MFQTLIWQFWLILQPVKSWEMNLKQLILLLAKNISSFNPIYWTHEILKNSGTETTGLPWTIMQFFIALCTLSEHSRQSQKYGFAIETKLIYSSHSSRCLKRIAAWLHAIISASIWDVISKIVSVHMMDTINIAVKAKSFQGTLGELKVSLIWLTSPGFELKKLTSIKHTGKSKFRMKPSAWNLLNFSLSESSMAEPCFSHSKYL